MVELRIQGADELFDGFEKIQSNSARADLMDRIGSYGVSSTQERFLQETDPDGEKWQKSRRAADEGGSTLRKDNYLFQSIAHVANSNNVAWGSNLVYAGIHQFGGEIRAKNVESLAFFAGGKNIFVKSVNIPKRAYLGLSNEDREEIKYIAQDWLSEALQ